MAETASLPASAPTPTLAPDAPASAPVVSLRDKTHRWRFQRVGGLDQVKLETADDIRNLPSLDQKLWVALSCPVKGLELDARTLELLDLDGDGRVRAPEIIAAIRWCEPRLRDLGALMAGGDALPLAAIHDATKEGRAALTAARRILEALGKAGADRLSAADVADTSKVFVGTLFNGDGVVTPEAALSAEVRAAMADAITCAGAVPDRSGKDGLSQGTVERFWAELEAYAAWWRKGDASPGVMVLGDRTAGAVEALRAARAKVDDFFVRCALAALAPRGAAALDRTDPEYAALAAKDLAAATADVAAFPLARVGPGAHLPLEAVNPAWSAAIAALRRDALAPLLGGDVRDLSPEGWGRVQGALAAADAWYGEKAGASVERLGRARVEALLAGGARREIEELIARDRAAEPEANGVADVVRLVHYHRDLYRLLNNFVTFADLYDGGAAAVFQAGTLYLDGRSCDLCVRVDDAAAHAALSASSRMCVAYCACRRPGAAMTVAACVTQGDSDFLTVGRNGIFYDRKGRDWDATVVKVVDSPISVRQAFFAPYKKFVRMVEENVARFAASKEKEAEASVSGAAAGVTDAATGAKPARPPAPADIGRTVGIVAALGVGIGALGTLLGGFVSGFMSLQPWWAKAVAVAGAVLLVSGPSMLVAWLKLRQRTLGPILDATGWAVNGRVKVNIPLGASLTARAVLPSGASRSMADPFEDLAARRNRRLAWAVVVAAAAALGAARWYHAWPFKR
jgi:hypothetical protein